MTEIATFGTHRVLHTPGTGLAVVTSGAHSEQLDLAGWKSRRRFYDDMAKRYSWPTYPNAAKACRAAIKALEGEQA